MWPQTTEGCETDGRGRVRSVAGHRGRRGNELPTPRDRAAEQHRLQMLQAQLQWSLQAQQKLMGGSLRNRPSLQRHSSGTDVSDTSEGPRSEQPTRCSEQELEQTIN